MVREDLLSDHQLNYKKSRNRNVTTTPPRYEKRQRGKSADRGNLDCCCLRSIFECPFQ